MLPHFDRSGRAIKRAGCFHVKGHKNPCRSSSNPYMILFGAVEIVFSQIPDFDQIWWLSIVAAVMSLAYSSIGLGLSIAKIAGHYNSSLSLIHSLILFSSSVHMIHFLLAG